jgi:hypothetical protein
VLVRLHKEIAKSTGAETMGIAVTLLTGAALKADGLAETVSAGVAANVPVYLQLPGPPGYTSSSARINEVLADAVAFKDKAAVLDILRMARARGRSGDRVPIVLKDQPSGATPPGEIAGDR